MDTFVYMYITALHGWRCWGIFKKLPQLRRGVSVGLLVCWSGNAFDRRSTRRTLLTYLALFILISLGNLLQLSGKTLCSRLAASPWILPTQHLAIPHLPIPHLPIPRLPILSFPDSEFPNSAFPNSSRVCRFFVGRFFVGQFCIGRFCVDLRNKKLVEQVHQPLVESMRQIFIGHK